MNITIIGTGYVGLVSAACFAEMGNTVTCLDIDANKIQQLQLGSIPIFEPYLEELCKRNIAAKRLSFTLDPVHALSGASICFLAVPTDASPSGHANLNPLYQVLDTLSQSLQGPCLIVIKSTVPIGTSAKAFHYLQEKLQSRQAPWTCDVAFNPEFLKEGSAVNDFLKPDRIIIGSENLATIALLKHLYTPFSISHDRILVMSSASAEMTKYAANAMLASRISLMNEIANLCEKVDASIHDVRVGIGSDQRIGYHFLYAGLGFGGSCFPKDIQSLKLQMLEHHVDHDMIDAIVAVNEKQRRLMKKKLANYFRSLEGRTLTLLGLSFKPETDDIRQASSLALIEQLKNEGCHLKVYDPAALEKVKRIYPYMSSITFCENEYEALNGSDALVLITEWKQFRQLDFDRIKTLMRQHAIFDGRNQYCRKTLESMGFYYEGVGV